jgi:hypothetical protein
MKALGVIVIMISLLMQTFSKGVVLLEFRLNRDFIAKNLCENRNRPTLKCGGRCQLMRQWKAEDDKAANEKAGKSNFTETCYTDQFLLLPSFTPTPDFLTHTAVYSVRISNKHTRRLFHPPGC